MSFGGLCVVSFESRRAPEMSSLIERHGGLPMLAPSMREIPHADNGPARAFAAALRAGELDVVVLMTGVGTRALCAAVASEVPASELAAALGRVVTVARGPKPAAVLRELSVAGFLTAPEPNTWREVLAVVAGAVAPGKRIGIQEHGAPSLLLHRELERAGHVVSALSVYRWALPEDVAPLRAALRAIAAGEARIALFTSQNQLASVLAVAAEEGLEERVRSALGAGVVASIGPVCTEALAAEGLAPDIEPEHARMGHLVKATAEGAAEVLRRKGG